MSDRWSTGRTEAFSDGVFAIAITLLVLDLSIPATEFHDLWGAIAGEWPAYLAYATSFLTIGGIWLTHHGIFARVQYVDRRLMTLNLLLLMAVSFLPFPTRLVAEAIRSVDAERAAATSTASRCSSSPCSWERSGRPPRATATSSSLR